MRLYEALVCMLVLASTINAASNFTVSNQLTSVRNISSGSLIGSAALTINYMNCTTGAIIHGDTFDSGTTYSIINGSANAQVGENGSNKLSLLYGEQYCLRYMINGEVLWYSDINGNPINNLTYYSPLGDIQYKYLIAFPPKASCPSGYAVQNATLSEDGIVLQCISIGTGSSNYSFTTPLIAYPNGTVVIQQSTAGQDGYLSATDWNAFAGKAATGTSATCDYGVSAITLAAGVGPSVSCASQQGTLGGVENSTINTLVANNNSLNTTLTDLISRFDIANTTLNLSLSQFLGASENATINGLVLSNTTIYEYLVNLSINDSARLISINALSENNKSLNETLNLLIYNLTSSYYNKTEVENLISNSSVFNATDNIYIYSSAKTIYQNETKLNQTISAIMQFFNTTLNLQGLGFNTTTQLSYIFGTLGAAENATINTLVQNNKSINETLTNLINRFDVANTTLNLSIIQSLGLTENSTINTLVANNKSMNDTVNLLIYNLTTNYYNKTDGDARYLGGGFKVFYFTNLTADIAGMKNTSLNLPTGAVAEITGTASADEASLAKFITPPVSVDYIVLGGVRQYIIYAKVSSIAKPTYLKGYVYTCNLDGSNVSLLRETSISSPLTLTNEFYTMDVLGEAWNVPNTSRIIFNITTYRDPTGPDTTVTLTVDDDSFSRFQVPIPTSVIDISGKLDATDQRYNESARVETLNQTVLALVETNSSYNATFNATIQNISALQSSNSSIYQYLINLSINDSTRLASILALVANNNSLNTTLVDLTNRFDVANTTLNLSLSGFMGSVENTTLNTLVQNNKSINETLLSLSGSVQALVINNVSMNDTVTSYGSTLAALVANNNSLNTTLGESIGNISAINLTVSSLVQNNKSLNETMNAWRSDSVGWLNTTGNISTTRNVSISAGLMLNTYDTQPTCAVATRGTLWMNQSAAGITDYLFACMKNSTDDYNWVLIMRGD